VAHLLGVVGTAVGAFVGTNIDDFVVLILLTLGMPLDGIRRWQIVTGQYLGFCGLLLISGLGAAALRTVPENWVGLLGVVPLALGIRGFVLLRRGSAASPEKPILASSMATVAIVTVANGGDNVSVYILLFRQLNVTDTVITILVFLIMLGALCAVALIVSQHARLIPGIVRRSRWLTPAVLVIIGIILLARTGTLTQLAERAS
jgi:cadmium resistance protein CadD (predicted permease)